MCLLLFRRSIYIYIIIQYTQLLKQIVEYDLRIVDIYRQKSNSISIKTKRCYGLEAKNEKNCKKWNNVIRIHF